MKAEEEEEKLELDLDGLEEMLDTVEECYAGFVNGEMTFGEWTWSFGWGPVKIDDCLEAATGCDSLDGTPLAVVDWRNDGSWEIALYPEEKVCPPIGCRLPSYKWRLTTVRSETDEADEVERLLQRLVDGRKAVILL